MVDLRLKTAVDFFWIGTCGQKMIVIMFDSSAAGIVQK